MRRLRLVALEKITEERYQSMVPAYEDERRTLLETKNELAASIAASEKIREDVEAFLPLVRQYTDMQELDAHVLNELIEKIVVHEKELDADGNKVQRVDIHYRFIGYIDPRTVIENALGGDGDDARLAAVVV